MSKTDIHEYKSDPQSGAGNCVCGHEERNLRHFHEFVKAMDSDICTCGLPAISTIHLDVVWVDDQVVAKSIIPFMNDKELQRKAREKMGVSVVDVPKKPITAAEMWPSKAFEKSDGLYLQYRDVTVGPFSDMGELKAYDDQVQAISRGERSPDTFVGRVTQYRNAYYVELWDVAAGPHASYEEARSYRDYRIRQQQHND
jgi:hypothetical protein